MMIIYNINNVCSLQTLNYNLSKLTFDRFIGLIDNIYPLY